MVELLGQIIGGLGLFFAGMWMLSENLKALATLRVRKIAANWTPNRFAALGWGAFSGGITQNMSALTFVVVSMLRANLLSRQRAYAFLLGGNVGGTFLALFISLDLQVAAFYLLGVASVLMVSERAHKTRTFGVALLGIAMLFVGLALVKDAAAPLASQPWAEQTLALSSRSLWLGFVAAAILTFVVQSSLAVIVLGISLGAIGLLGPDQLMMIVYGAHLGSSVILLVLSWNLSGASRQIAMFQIGFNVILCAVFVPLFYVELLTNVPLVKTLVLSNNLDLAQQMSLLFILLNGIPALVLLIFVDSIERLLARFWPVSDEERISQLEWFHDRAYADIGTAIELVALEQRRAFSILSGYLDAARNRNDIDSLREPVKARIGEIELFLTKLTTRNPGRAVEDVNSMFSQQRLLGWLEDHLAQFCSLVNQLPDEGLSDQLQTSLIESIDAVMLVINDALTSADEHSWSQVRKLTGDRSELLRDLRSAYVTRDSGFSEVVRSDILKAINLAGEVFFLLARLVREMEDSSALTFKRTPTREFRPEVNEPYVKASREQNAVR